MEPIYIANIIKYFIIIASILGTRSVWKWGCPPASSFPRMERSRGSRGFMRGNCRQQRGQVIDIWCGWQIALLFWVIFYFPCQKYTHSSHLFTSFLIWWSSTYFRHIKKTVYWVDFRRSLVSNPWIWGWIFGCNWYKTLKGSVKWKKRGGMTGINRWAIYSSTLPQIFYLL